MLLEARSLKVNGELCDVDVEAGESSVQVLPRVALLDCTIGSHALPIQGFRA
jgi:hypothetical protein